MTRNKKPPAATGGSAGIDITAIYSTKACVACGAFKALNEFIPDARKPDGRRHKCRSCTLPLTGDQIAARLLRGKPGLRARIDAMCVTCVFDHLERGNWRQQVGACEITDCPLWPVRPRSGGAA